MTKKELSRSVSARRNAALYGVLKPQWKRCFWTRPFGHIRDGRTAKDLHHIQEYSAVCLHCGKPTYLAYNDVEAQEAHASIANRYPIAQAVSKREATA